MERRLFGVKVRVNGKKVSLPVQLRVKAKGGIYDIYCFEKLNLYVKVKHGITEPGIQPSGESLKKVDAKFVSKVLDAFEFF